MSSISSNSAYIRPISVMSLLADQMESSTLTEDKACDIEGNDIVNNSFNYDVDYKLISHENCMKYSNISTSVPSHRHSFSSGYCRLSNNQMLSTASPESNVLKHHELPTKRKCHSVTSTNDYIARPIPIKICIKSQDNDNINIIATNPLDDSCCLIRAIPEKPAESPTKFQPIARLSSNISKKVSLCQNQRNNCGASMNRPVIFAHKKSAFISTRSANSPHTSTSDYSMSPDIESPMHRSESVTSSGFHECSQQSLLVDTNCSPDSNQRSGCATITNKTIKPSDHSSVIFTRCHSQPSYDPVLRNINNHPILIRTHKSISCQTEVTSIRTNSQIHVPLKRRYPSLSQIVSANKSDTICAKNTNNTTQPCYKCVTSSADTSPSPFKLVFPNCKREGYFFGNNRNYLVSLPRIASSPTPFLPQSITSSHKDDSLKKFDQTDSLINRRQRKPSNSTSTTTDTTAPTIVPNFSSLIYLKRSTLLDNSISTNKENLEDVEMMEADEYTMDNVNRSSTKAKIDFHSHTDGLFNISLSSERDQLQFWEDRSFIKSRQSTGSCSVSVTSSMTTNSYSTNSEDPNNGAHVQNCIGNSDCESSSRSEYRDPDDPPEIVGDSLVNNVSSIGFCFRQLTNNSDLMNYNQNPSFQELDLDQIELD